MKRHPIAERKRNHAGFGPEKSVGGMRARARLVR
jgi:hypothetical protein